MAAGARYFADRYVVAWPDGRDVFLKRARSLEGLRCSWAAAEVLLNADGDDAASLSAELAERGVEDPSGVVRAACEAGILADERQAEEADAFFASWAWSPEAATLLFGYRTDGFVDPDAEAATPPVQGDAAPALLPQPAGPLHALPPRGPRDALGALIARRRSRTFQDGPIELTTVASCLRDAFGLTGQIVREDGHVLPLTGAPSPGGLNTFDGWLLAKRVSGLRSGSYRYVPQHDALARERGEPVPFDRLFGGQGWCADAACAVVLVADLRRLASRYDFPTTIPAALIEAGARVELLLLRAEAAGLSATIVGMAGVGAFDGGLAAKAGLPCASAMTVPMCAVLIGVHQNSSN